MVLIDYVLGLIRDSRSAEEAYRRVLGLRARLQEVAFDQLVEELGL